LTLYI